MKKLIVSTALLLALSGGVQAQGPVRGAARGADEGGAAAGPVGAVVGGAVGAATGTVGGILGVDERPRFRTYVEEEHVPSYAYPGDLQVGVVLPPEGVTYYDLPPEYGVTEYRYTVVNDEPVLVNPRTRAVVEVID